MEPPYIYLLSVFRRPIIQRQCHRYYAITQSITPNPLPASFLRGGTSKGIFLNRDHLPPDPGQWSKIFLGIMGSPDAQYGRQLNGMGGGVSSLSKICVVGKPTHDEQRDDNDDDGGGSGIQLEYTFVQVGIKDDNIDLGGNCGNLSSVVGAFAVDEGIVCQQSLNVINGRVTVRSFNTNTKKIIDTTFPVTQKADDGRGHFVSDLNRPETAIAGVQGKASKIILDFIHPAGARTGKLLPTGAPLSSISLSHPTRGEFNIDVSLIDATNPTVFASYCQLSQILPVDDYICQREPALTVVGGVLENIRQRGAEAMGLLAPSAPSQPKIALLRPPILDDLEKGVDIVIHALSMGVLHKAVPMTVGLCLGVAANVEGSLAWKIVQQSRRENQRRMKGGRKDDYGVVRIKHPSGIVDVGAEFGGTNGEVKSAKVIRTGRKLMKGMVWW